MWKRTAFSLLRSRFFPTLLMKDSTRVRRNRRWFWFSTNCSFNEPFWSLKQLDRDAWVENSKFWQAISTFCCRKKVGKKRYLSLRTFLRTFTWQLWEEYAFTQNWKGNRTADCRSVCVFQQNASSRKKNCADPTNEQWIQNVFERLRQHLIEEGFTTGSNCTWEVSAMRFSNSSWKSFSSGSH